MGTVSSNLTLAASFASVAQLVERRPEKAGVGGSIPPRCTKFLNYEKKTSVKCPKCKSKDFWFSVFVHESHSGQVKFGEVLHWGLEAVREIKKVSCRCIPCSHAWSPSRKEDFLS